ncbi:hypothetical protein CYLTODRAFT_424150 [Cylindrobasidium torrendii FP15055 ss-10]|uniref:DUF6699 domain-containing protein n=1 Tax=Cylindrobasidium torrendii FP15055 ss-10 TaxID=1314674 RepID=A0A0D7B543_9AGAR|nr:hypothetical protein CYLTODRAFT_424150 [Cylindrobasidium torrendii FP15055 ss-10]
MNFWPQQQPAQQQFNNALPAQWANAFPGQAPSQQQQQLFNQFGQPAGGHGFWPFNKNDNDPSPFRGSSKHVDLHPILAADTTLVAYNVTTKPNAGINPYAYTQNAHYPSTRLPTKCVRLVSLAFPWMIEVKGAGGVTVGMIWEALHAMFQVELQDSEWGAAILDRKIRTAIEKASKKRTEGKKDTKLRRIDWLGDAVYFRGLDRDPEFEKARLLPGQDAVADTWVVKMSTS